MHAAPRGTENQKLVPLLLSRGASWSLKWGERRGRWVGWARGGRGRLPTPSVVLCVLRSRVVPAFAPCSLEGAVGHFDLFVSCPESAPTAHMHVFVLSPLEFLSICHSRRRLSRYKHCSERSHIPACPKDSDDRAETNAKQKRVAHSTARTHEDRKSGVTLSESRGATLGRTCTDPLPRGRDGQMSGHKSSTWNSAWDPVSARRQGPRWGCSCSRDPGSCNLRVIGALGGVMGKAGGAKSQSAFKAVLAAVTPRSLSVAQGRTGLLPTFTADAQRPRHC